MSPDTITVPLLTALVSFTFVNSVTPGPNNIMLTTSGVNFGLARTVPHMAGIFTGLILVMLATGFGLGFVFQEYPLVRRAVQAAGIAYTLYLAWKIATAGSLGTVFGEVMRHPVSRNHARLVRHTELLKDVDGMLHDLPIAGRPHDHADDRRLRIVGS